MTELLEFTMIYDFNYNIYDNLFTKIKINTFIQLHKNILSISIIILSVSLFSTYIDMGNISIINLQRIFFDI
jgi:uncharacterized membrane protein YqhA